MVEENVLDISSEVIHDALNETIENKLKSKNFRISLSLASKAGENNFIGIIYRVAFNKRDENDKSSTTDEQKLILKIAPQSEARRAQFYARPAFTREIFTYDKVKKQDFCERNSNKF